jgi:hypothetical protein
MIWKKLKQVAPVWRWLILVAIVAALAIPVRNGAEVLYRSVEDWRAHQLMAEAAALLAQHEETAAESKMTAAYYLAPHDLDILRGCAQEELKAGDSRSLAFYQALLQEPGVTRADRRDALRASLAFGDMSGAESLAGYLAAHSPEAEDDALLAQLEWAEHRPQQAVVLLRQALAVDPKDREDEVLLAKMLILSGNAEYQAEALTMLRSVAQTQDQLGLNALIIMSKNQDLDEPTRRDLLDQLWKHPLLNDEGRFAAWGLEVRLGDRDPKVVLQQAVDFFKSATLSRKSVAARWLYGEGEPELALELAQPPDTAASQDLFLVRLDALSSLKNWTEVRKELADPKAPLPQSIDYLYRARADQELGDEIESKADWDRARSAAFSESGMLEYLERYALQVGDYEQAQKTLSKMTEQFPAEAQKGYVALLQAEAKSGQTQLLLQTLKQMTVDLPYEPEAKNDWAYLSLLLNLNVDEAQRTAENLVENHPEFLAYRNTLALAEIRKNDPQAAQQAYQGLKIDWSTAPAGGKAIYAVVLAANGEKIQANEFARAIDRSQLRPEELALLNTYLPL